MSETTPLSPELGQFIQDAKWTFAKTYATTWPHEYIVRDREDESLFVKLVLHIRTHGYQARFYKRTITYFDHDERVYWTMGEPIDETTIVNRCQREQTYECRFAHNLLPEQQTKTPNLGLLRTSDPQTVRQSAAP